MFERLILADYAVADLTGANANVYYELGMRHGIRPSTTVPIFAMGELMPFDVAPMRALPYRLGLVKRGNVLSDEAEHGAEGGVSVAVIKRLLSYETARIARGAELRVGASALFVAQKHV